VWLTPWATAGQKKMAVPRWATRVGSVRCAGARAGACLARRVGRRVRPCAGEGPGAVARGNHAPRTGRPRTLWVPPRLGWGVWSGFVGPPPRRGTGRATVGLWRAQGTASHCRKTVCIFFRVVHSARPLSCPRPQLLRPSGGVCGEKGLGPQPRVAGYQQKSKT